MSGLRSLYERVILKHAKSPVGLNKDIEATHSGRADNPFCGDEVNLQLRIYDDRITQVAYSGEFCAVCSASASLLCDHIAGMALEEFRSFSQQLLAGLGGQQPPETFPEDLQALLAVRQYPVRIQCAALPWQAARRAAGCESCI